MSITAVEADDTPQDASEYQRLTVKLARAERDLTKMFVRMGRCDTATRRATMRKIVAEQYHKIGGLHARMAKEEASGRS